MLATRRKRGGLEDCPIQCPKPHYLDTPRRGEIVLDLKISATSVILFQLLQFWPPHGYRESSFPHSNPWPFHHTRLCCVLLHEIARQTNKHSSWNTLMVLLKWTRLRPRIPIHKGVICFRSSPLIMVKRSCSAPPMAGTPWRYRILSPMGYLSPGPLASFDISLIFPFASCTCLTSSKYLP